MYTPVPWGNDDKFHAGDGSSFVFHFGKDDWITIYPHKGKGKKETWHTDGKVFAMAGGGPYA